MQSAGDSRFETMTMPHVNALFQTALRLTENRPGAEEVVREVYACAWKSFDGREEWSDWRLGLFKILIHRLHRRNRGWFGIPSSPKLDQPVKHERSECKPDRAQPVRSEKYTEEPRGRDTFWYSPEQLVSALTRVPVVFREIILLVDCQEFSYRDAADILGLSSDVVADRLVLGRKHLRSELAIVHSTMNAASKNGPFFSRELGHLREPFV